MSSPPQARQVRQVSGALVGLAVAFVGGGALGLLNAPRANMVTLGLVLLAADVVIAGALVTRWYPVRPVAQGLAIFGTLVHLLVLLHTGPIWLRGCAGLLAAAHILGLVLLFQMSASEHDEDDGIVVPAAPAREAEAERDGSEPAEPAWDGPGPGEPARDEPARDELARDEPARDEPAGDEPAGDEPARDESARDEPTRDESARDEPTPGESAGDEPTPGESARVGVGEGDGVMETAESDRATVSTGVAAEPGSQHREGDG